jgi:hypothetical protein
LLASNSFGAIHLSLQGSLSKNYLGLQTHSSRSVSGSVAVDLGQYFRLGVTHREAFMEQEGYGQTDDTNTYVYAKTIQKVVSNSLDLTLILYYGDIFVPYVMAGVVVKNYDVETDSSTEGRVRQKFSGPMVPNGGFGLGIRLSKDFSIKLSYTASPGVKQETPEVEAKSVLDDYTSVGITYNI